MKGRRMGGVGDISLGKDLEEGACWEVDSTESKDIVWRWGGLAGCSLSEPGQ